MIVHHSLQLNTLEVCQPIKAKDLYARLGKHKMNADYQTTDPRDDTVPIVEPHSNLDRVSHSFTESRKSLLKAVECFERNNNEDFSELKEYIRNH